MRYLASYEYDDGEGGGAGALVCDDMGDAVRAAVARWYRDERADHVWHRADVSATDCEDADEALEAVMQSDGYGAIWHADDRRGPIPTYEMDEDGAGALYVYECVTAGPSDEPVPVWGARYYGVRDRLGYTGEEYAGMDWHALMVQGLDPLREGWEGMPREELAGCYGETCGDYIALSEWDGTYPLGLDAARCGEAGRLAAMAAGAAYRCPECGETLPTVRDVSYPDTWVTPPRCGCCGSALEP